MEYQVDRVLHRSRQHGSPWLLEKPARLHHERGVGKYDWVSTLAVADERKPWPVIRVGRIASSSNMTKQSFALLLHSDDDFSFSMSFFEILDSFSNLT